MLIEDVGVVVLGFMTELIVKDKFVDGGTWVLISTIRLVEFVIVQVEAIPDRLQVEEPILIVLGNTIITKDVETSRLTFLNQSVYRLIALILVLAIVSPNSVIVEGVATISTVALSTR